jgi:hypothetical protein
LPGHPARRPNKFLLEHNERVEHSFLPECNGRRILALIRIPISHQKSYLYRCLHAASVVGHLLEPFESYLLQLLYLFKRHTGKEEIASNLRDLIVILHY